MRTCGRFIGGIFAVLFIVTAVVTLLVYNLNITLFKSETYKRVLVEEEIYSRLPGFIGEQIRYGMEYNPCLESPDQCEGDSGEGESHGGPPIYFRILSDDDWEHLFVTILDPEWIQVSVESVLDQIFENLNSTGPSQPITVSLVSLKAKLRGDVGYEAAQDLLAKQPDCSVEQIFKLTEAQLTGGEIDDFLLCNPPAILNDVVDPLMRDAIRVASSAIPDEMAFDLPLPDGGETTEIESYGDDPLQAVLVVRRWVPFTLLLPLTCLVLMTLFAVRSLRDWLLWWGVPFLLVGLIGLAYSIFSTPVVAWVVPRFIEKVVPAIAAPEVFSAAMDISTAIVRQVMGKIMIQAGVIAAIGLGFLISAFFVTPAGKEYGDPLSDH